MSDIANTKMSQALHFLPDLGDKTWSIVRIRNPGDTASFYWAATSLRQLVLK